MALPESTSKNALSRVYPCLPWPLGHRLCYFNSEIALILTSTWDKSATPELTMRPVTSRQKQRPSFKNLWSGSVYTPRLISSAALPGRSQTLRVVGYSWDTCSHPWDLGTKSLSLFTAAREGLQGVQFPRPTDVQFCRNNNLVLMEQGASRDLGTSSSQL